MQQIYHVSFFKRLTDSTGHPVNAWQGAVDVRASDEERAIELGRQRFAEIKDVSEWSLRADYEIVEPVVARVARSRRRAAAAAPVV